MPSSERTPHLVTIVMFAAMPLAVHVHTSSMEGRCGQDV